MKSKLKLIYVGVRGCSKVSNFQLYHYLKKYHHLKMDYYDFVAFINGFYHFDE